MKKRDPRIARIPALRPGPVRTLYEISRDDADLLLRAARRALLPDEDVAKDVAQRAFVGGGFGTLAENKNVEKAAVSFVRKHLRARKWKVADVSSDKRGYDLHCRRGREALYVEVKGAKSSKVQFVVTANEKDAWSRSALRPRARDRCAQFESNSAYV